MIRKPRPAEPRAHKKHVPVERGFLDRYWPLVLVGLFLAALIWRLGYLRRLAATPLAGTLLSDERVYWDWATFLTDHGFRATNPFFLGPLYPYVLAFVRSAFGAQISGILVVQAVWGAAIAALLADSARRLTRPAVALGLGLTMAAYEMAVLFDGLILVESLLLFLEALLLWSWCRVSRAPAGTIAFAGIGLLTGLIAQCRATGALLLLPALMLAVLAQGPNPSSRRARPVALIAAFVLTMLPAAVWNWSASRELIPFTYNLGYNLYVGNNPAADGSFVWVVGPRQLAPVEVSRADGGGELDGREYLRRAHGLTLSPAQSSAHWAREALAFIRTNPGKTLALVGKKLLMLFNRHETPQIESMELFRRLAGPVGLPVAGTFLVVGSLGLVGLVYAGRWAAIGLALRLSVLLVTVGVLPFFVTDRYRVHLVPALALLAAMAVETLVVRWRTRPRQSIRGWAVAALGALALVALPVEAQDRRREEWVAARSLGVRWLEQGRPDLATRELGRAIRLERLLHIDRDPDPELAQNRAELYFNYGVALRHTGNEEEALTWLRVAAETDPANPRYVRTLGDAYLVHGRVREGDSLLRRVRSLVGGDAESMLSEGWRAAREGQLGQAEELFRQSTAKDARLYGAWLALIRVQVQRGELARAKETLLRAARTGIPAHSLKAHEALVEAVLGDTGAARRALEQVPQSAIDGDPTLARVVSRTRELLQKLR